LENVPLLAGDDGLAARRAGELQREKSEATATADALAGFVEVGRVIAAPPGVRGGLLRCLDQSLHEVMTDPEFEAAAARANRTLDVAAAEATTAEIRAAATTAPRLLRIVEEPIRRIRG
jgi:tripartite-type tricarboxylate transporter receptor subunit TctC